MDHRHSFKKRLFLSAKRKKEYRTEFQELEENMSEYIDPDKINFVVLNCEDAFKELTEKEKLYSHYMSKACWYGNLIDLLQKSPEGVHIYTLLHKLFRSQSVSVLANVARDECGFQDKEFTAFLMYACGIFYYKCNYKRRSDYKFIPDVPRKKFENLVRRSKFYKENKDTAEQLLSNCVEAVYFLKNKGSLSHLSCEESERFLISACDLFMFSSIVEKNGAYVIDLKVSKEKFADLVRQSEYYKEKKEVAEQLLSNCVEAKNSSNDKECHSLCDSVSRLSISTQDATTNFSENISKEDEEIVEKFMNESGILTWNTRLFKWVNETGETVYEIRLASVLGTVDEEDKDILGEYSNGNKFFVSRGDYNKLLAIVNKYLLIAKQYAANENEIKMIEKYIHSFRTGSLDAHEEGYWHWVTDKEPIVESSIGFNEILRNPAAMRAEFEGWVAVANKKTSAKFTNLVDSAESFLPLLPWPSAYEKNNFSCFNFILMDALTIVDKIIISGIRIPNCNKIKEKDAFLKNIIFGNVFSVKPTEPPNFLSKEDQDIILQYHNRAFEVSVGLHDLLGCNSGKLFKREKDGSFNFDVQNVLNFETNELVTSWYEDGETYSSVFGAMGSSYEECRAECVALYLADVPEILKIFGYEGAEAETITYAIWLDKILSGVEGLKLYNPKTKSWPQAALEARYVILQVLLECGQDFVKVEKTDDADGTPNLLVTVDRTKILCVGKPAIGKFLGKLQLYKSTADITSAKAMFNKYSAVISDGKNPFLNYGKIVMARSKPGKLFIQANTFLDDSKESVYLKNYEANVEGMIDSWIERFQDDNVDDILEELCAIEKVCFSWPSKK